MVQFEVKKLTFSYPDRKENALEDINLQINKGDYVVICGKSGSGKSTLLRHFKEALAPHGKLTGGVYYNGEDIKQVDLRTQTQDIGYVMQNSDDQIVTDKVWHELAFGLESLGLNQKQMRVRVAEMASFFGIEDWFYKDVCELSGGQKQLLNLAAIMVMQPSVIILDEPTSQLDPIAAADFLNTIRRINVDLGTTIIISEHRLEDVFVSADNVIVMEEGKVLISGDVKEVGDYLYKENNDMLLAMPTVMQIHFGIVKKNPPYMLTVRDGRRFLEKYIDSPVNILLEENEYNEDSYKDYAVQIKSIRYKYEKDGDDVLKDVSLNIPQGVIYGILGGNGAGKTTLLGSICNINKPYGGKVIINGKNINKYKGSSLFENNIAMLPQDPRYLFVKSTVRDELLEMVDKKNDNQIGEVIKLTEIEGLLDSHPYDLSGGEQQRVGLAKVLLCNPKILLLDEPTKGIDCFFKDKLARILANLKGKGMTIIMVSHDVEYCSKYCDIVAMLFAGDIVTVNTPRKFFANNSYYTTVANKISRGIIDGAIVSEDIINYINSEEK